MKPPIFTAGYALRQPDELLIQARHYKARLLDIRLHAKSDKPGWNKDELAALFGPRYHHVPALGNLGRFLPGQGEEDGDEKIMRIANPAMGLAIVERHLTTGSVILLCGCRDLETCHRHVVAQALRLRGHTVQELMLAFRVEKMPLPIFAKCGLAIPIYSEVLGCEVVLAADNAPVDENETRPVYRARELALLPGCSPDGLRLLNETKTVFGAEIEPEETRSSIAPTADMFAVVDSDPERDDFERQAA